MLFPKLHQDLRARGRLVPDDFTARFLLESGDQIARKSVRIRLERRFDLQPHQFPMAGHRILAGRNLGHFAEVSRRFVHRA
ncbi:hypothetical protein D3C76_1606120 [compost metagenome]